MCRRRWACARAGAQPVCAAVAAFSGAVFQPRNCFAGWGWEDAAGAIAVATGMPGFMVALYSVAGVSPVSRLAAGPVTIPGPPPYWVQVNHHFFFVLYSFVAMGLVTVFEWDLFFPDLAGHDCAGHAAAASSAGFFGARVAAIGIFIAGFLFDANFLAPLCSRRLSIRRICRVFWRGMSRRLRPAGCMRRSLIWQCRAVLLAVLGERLFRRVSLLLQGTAVTVLLMLFLLFPVLSGVTPCVSQSGSGLCCGFRRSGFWASTNGCWRGLRRCRFSASWRRIGCAALLRRQRSRWWPIRWLTCGG